MPGNNEDVSHLVHWAAHWNNLDNIVDVHNTLVSSILKDLEGRAKRVWEDLTNPAIEGECMEIDDKLQLINAGVHKTDPLVIPPKSAPVCIIDLPTKVIKQEITVDHMEVYKRLRDAPGNAADYRLDTVLMKDTPYFSSPKVIVIKPKNRVLKYGIKRIPGIGKRRRVIRVIKSKLDQYCKHRSGRV